MKTFRIRTTKDDAYRVRMYDESIEAEDITASLDIVSVYDGEDDDILITPTNVNLEWDTFKDEDGHIDIMMSGTFEVTDDDAKLIDDADYIDYAIDFYVNGEGVDGDGQDYEFLENYKVIVEEA